MTTPQSSRNYAIATGSSTSLGSIVSTRSPSTSDIGGPSGNFQIGQKWVNTSQNLTSALNVSARSIVLNTMLAYSSITYRASSMSIIYQPGI